MRCTAFVIGKGEIRTFTIVKVPRHRPLVLLVMADCKQGKAVGRGTNKVLQVDCCMLTCSIFRIVARYIIRQWET